MYTTWKSRCHNSFVLDCCGCLKLNYLLGVAVSTCSLVWKNICGVFKIVGFSSSMCSGNIQLKATKTPRPISLINLFESQPPFSMHSVLMLCLHVFRALARSSTCFSAYVFDVGTAIPRQRDKAICLCPPLRSMESHEFWTAGTLRGQPGRCPCCWFFFSTLEVVILSFVGNLDFGFFSSWCFSTLWSL